MVRSLQARTVWSWLNRIGLLGQVFTGQDCYVISSQAKTVGLGIDRPGLVGQVFTGQDWFFMSLQARTGLSDLYRPGPLGLVFTDQDCCARTNDTRISEDTQCVVKSLDVSQLDWMM